MCNTTNKMIETQNKGGKASKLSSENVLWIFTYFPMFALLLRKHSVQASPCATPGQAHPYSTKYRQHNTVICL